MMCYKLFGASEGGKSLAASPSKAFNAFRLSNICPSLKKTLHEEDEEDLVREKVVDSKNYALKRYRGWFKCGKCSQFATPELFQHLFTSRGH